MVATGLQGSLLLSAFHPSAAYFSVLWLHTKMLIETYDAGPPVFSPVVAGYLQLDAAGCQLTKSVAVDKGVG